MKKVFYSISIILALGMGVAPIWAGNISSNNSSISDEEMETTVKNRIAQKSQEVKMETAGKYQMTGDIPARASSQVSVGHRVYEISGSNMVQAPKKSPEELVENIFNNLMPNELGD